MVDNLIINSKENNKTSNRLINREVSWLSFNMRVMEQSSNKIYPLLERLRFLSISASNLDEFYMVRVAGLRALMLANTKIKSDDGLTPLEQLKKIKKLTDSLVEIQQNECCSILTQLRDKNLNLICIGNLDDEEKKWLEKYFLENVFPILTPLAIDLEHPFPFIPNLGFSLMVELKRNSDDETLLVLVPIPSQTKRFIRLPDKQSDIRFISLENIISFFIKLIFPNYQLVSEGVFRVIRDSELEVEEKAEDLVMVFESALKKRRRGDVVRLEINKAMPKNLSSFIFRNLNILADEVSAPIAFPFSS